MRTRHGLLVVAIVAGCGLCRSAAAADSESHEVRQMSGWQVHVSRQLLNQDAPATQRALKLLGEQLENIVRVVPQAALVELQKVPMWVSPEYPDEKPHAAYHPNVNWLRQHGRDPDMAKSVEFTNVRIFDAETRRMPVFALYELAHAYYDRVLGGQREAVKAAYEKAKAGGKYDKVQRKDAAGRVSEDRAYAMKDPHEYFAESTEAYFGRNDFFPFTREELAKHDPEMCQLLARLWRVTPAPAEQQRAGAAPVGQPGERSARP